MILTGNEIERQVANGRIHIDPFDPLSITTNSYDLTLGAKFCRYENDVLDPYGDNPFSVFDIGEQELVLERGDFLLGHSVERLGSDHYVPIIHARSTVARLGLFVHITADLIDIGSVGQVTFQLYATMPIRISAGLKLGQVSFWRPMGDIQLYNGKYQGSVGPNPSKAYQDISGRHSLKSDNSAPIQLAGSQPVRAALRRGS